MILDAETQGGGGFASVAFEVEGFSAGSYIV
jgi:hypothetical protein